MRSRHLQVYEKVLRLLQYTFYLLLILPNSKLTAKNNCLKKVLRPPQFQGFFSPSEESYYHIARTSKANKSGKKTSFTHLVRINLNENRMTGILKTFKNVHIHGILPVYEQERLIAIHLIRDLNHKKSVSPGCIHGEIEIKRLSLTQNSNQKSPPLKLVAKFKLATLVESPEGPAVADLQNKILWTGKKRAKKFERFKFELGKNEIPLYVSKDGKVYSWKQPSAQDHIQGVIARVRGKGIVGKLKVEATDYILQDHQYMTILHPLGTYNTLQVIDLKNWSGVNINTTRTLTLPRPAMPVVEAGVMARFKHHIALVKGKSSSIQQRWRRVALFNYSKNHQIAKISATKTSYPIYSSLSPRGNWMVVEMVHNNDPAATRVISLYSVLTNSWSHGLIVGKDPEHPKIKVKKDLK